MRIKSKLQIRRPVKGRRHASWKLIPLTAFLALAFGLTPTGLLSEESTGVEELTIAPTSFRLWVEATGVLRATSVQNFGGPPAFGNYWQFQIVNMIPEGKNVKAGDTLMSFDVQRLRDDLQRLQNELDQSTKELEKTKVQIDLEHQDLASKLAAAESKYEKAKLKQSGDELFESASKVEEDRLATEQARREVTLRKERIEWHKKSSEATYKIITSKKARAQNKLNELKKGIEDLQIKANRDGVVVYKVKWNGDKFKVGETVWSSQTVMEIPDLNTILAEAFVPEVDVGKVKLGQTAEVIIDAFPGKSYSGKITEIGTLVRPKAWDMPNKILEVRIALDQLNTSIMRPAMSIRAKVETAVMPNVIAVPLKAVHTTAAGTMVKVKSETGWREQRVKLGESNGTNVIIAEGLKAGDRIAMSFSKAR